MAATATSYPAEAQQRIDDHLDAIDRVLADSGHPSHDRVAILDEVENQIRDTVAERCPSGATPSTADVEAVLCELDPPESYADLDAPPPAASPSSAPPASPAGIVSLTLTIVGFAIVAALLVFFAMEKPPVSDRAVEMMALAAMLIFPLGLVCGLVGRRSVSGKLGACMCGTCCLIGLAMMLMMSRGPG